MTSFVFFPVVGPSCRSCDPLPRSQ